MLSNVQRHCIPNSGGLWNSEMRGRGVEGHPKMRPHDSVQRGHQMKNNEDRHPFIANAKVKIEQKSDGTVEEGKTKEGSGTFELKKACWQEDGCKITISGPEKEKPRTPEIIYLKREEMCETGILTCSTKVYLSEAVKGTVVDLATCRIDLSKDFEIRSTLVWSNAIRDLDILVRNRECWDKSLEVVKAECKRTKGVNVCMPEEI